jgi:predicted nuclease of restriction endonuclease-like (RecB) superfamily
MAALATRWPEPIAQQPVARLAWGHITVILDKCQTVTISEFYARRAAEKGWSRSALQAMIANHLHERSQPALTTFDRAVPEVNRDAVREVVKDPFILAVQPTILFHPNGYIAGE